MRITRTFSGCIMAAASLMCLRLVGGETWHRWPDYTTHFAAATDTRSQQPTTIPTTAPTSRPIAHEKLGIYLMDANYYPTEKERYLALGGNLIVNTVAPGARGDKLGLHPLDVIKRINGKEMQTTGDVVKEIQSSDRLKIEIIRDGKSLTLDEQPPDRP